MLMALNNKERFDPDMYRTLEDVYRPTVPKPGYESNGKVPNSRKPSEMPTKKTDQRRKFEDAAREAGASEDPREFERALRGVAKAPQSEKVQARKKAPEKRGKS